MFLKAKNITDRTFFKRLKLRIAGTDLFYLAGPIDSRKEKNYGADWRKQYSADLEALGAEMGFSLKAFDPSKEEPDMLGYSFEDWGNLKTTLRINKDFRTFRKMMTAVMNLDLKKISDSSVVIIRWRNEIPAVGTIHELLYARKLGIPAVLIFEDKREEMNPWLDCLCAQLNIDIFYSWAEFLADLHDKYRYNFGFSFIMRSRRIIRRLGVMWHKFLLDLVDIFAPHPLSNFNGERNSKVYSGEGSFEPPKQRIIFLIGPPLHGKTTQAEELGRLLKLRHIETSALIRDAINGVPAKLPQGQDFRIELFGNDYSLVEEKRKYDAKELNDSNFVFGLIMRALEEALAFYNGVVFSGSPRKIEEANKLLPILRQMFPNAVFQAFEFSDLPDAELFRRASERQRDLGFDAPEAVIKRKKIYEEETKPVVEYLRRCLRVKVKKINPDQSKSHVTRCILHCLE